MIYLILLGTFFLATWLNAKFIKDTSGKDQYWHTVQFYGWVWTYLSYMWLSNEWLIIICFGLMYSLMYNSLLNLMRKLEWTHLGRYDMPLWLTVVLFIIGLTGQILIVVKGM